MQSWFPAAVALACPIGMGLMMWLMMRGQHKDAGGERREVTELRAQVDQLKAERAGNIVPTPGERY